MFFKNFKLLYSFNLFQVKIPPICVHFNKIELFLKKNIKFKKFTGVMF